MPFDRKRYPKNWEEIRARIQERAGNKCEWCGVANHAVGARDKDGVWHDKDNIEVMNSGLGMELFPRGFPKMVRIVCTTAHVGPTKHDKMDCRDEVLFFLCQRCHLNEDREEHISNAAATRDRKRREAIAATGQLELIA